MKKYISPFRFFDNLLSPRLQEIGDKIWSASQFKKYGRELPFAALIALCLAKHFQRPYFIFSVGTEEVDYKIGYWDNSEQRFITHNIEQVDVRGDDVDLDPQKIYKSIAEFVANKKFSKRVFSENDMLFCRLYNFVFEGFSGDKMSLSFKEINPNVKQIWFMGQSEPKEGVFKVVQIYPFVDNSIDSIRPEDKLYLQVIYQNFINAMLTGGKLKQGLNGEYFLASNSS